MYEFRSFPNSFQISEPSLLSCSDARRFDGGGESESEGDRGRFLSGTFPGRGVAPAADLTGFDLGTGLLDCEGLTAEDESLGIVEEDDLALSTGRDCEDDLDPDGLGIVLPLVAEGCDFASDCEAASA